jgi:hypothetical protein
MTLWVLERSKDALGVYFSRGELIPTINAEGISPMHVRQVFSEMLGQASARFSCVNSKGLVEMCRPMDLMFWSWVPIFSQRAKALLVSLGVTQGEFVECEFSGETSKCYMHLPVSGCDFIDYERSIFSGSIPLDVPLPFGVVDVVQKRDFALQSAPGVFRAVVPGHTQLLSDLFATDLLAKLWQSAELTGGAFRRVAL